VDVQINVVVGPEAIAGSTRLKAATAQKMILNMISTASMVKTGKVYQNLMVDLKPASEKLVERAKGIIVMLAGLVRRSGGYLRAVRTKRQGKRRDGKLRVGRDEAEAILKRRAGFSPRAGREVASWAFSCGCSGSPRRRFFRGMRRERRRKERADPLLAFLDAASVDPLLREFEAENPGSAWRRSSSPGRASRKDPGGDRVRNPARSLRARLGVGLAVCLRGRSR